MIVESLSNTIDIKRYLDRLGVESGGVNILKKKSKIHLISIKDLHVGAANILKQDALSIGADLAVPRGTILAQTPRVDCMLIASTKALLQLSTKELIQPFGLKELAGKLKKIAESQKSQSPQIMGVINANDDSFFSSSRFDAQSAMGMIEKMVSDGASIIDIGGVSSAPNAKCVTADEELSRVKPIIDLIEAKNLSDKVAFSIDSYTPKVIEYALASGFKIVNDITGLMDDTVCSLCAKYDATVVIMHMQGTPQTMQNNPKYNNILDDVYNFLQERIQKAEKFGIEDIILDVGIGFGKTLDDNLMLIKHLGHFKTLAKPLLVGASRKSMIDKIIKSEVDERLPGTLAIHLEAIKNGASILRVHDVKEHSQAIKVQEKLDSI